MSILAFVWKLCKWFKLQVFLLVFAWSSRFSHDPITQEEEKKLKKEYDVSLILKHTVWVCRMTLWISRHSPKSSLWRWLIRIVWISVGTAITFVRSKWGNNWFGEEYLLISVTYLSFCYLDLLIMML